MTEKTYVTAYFIDGWMYLVEGEETRFEAHDRLMALWKEIARPSTRPGRKADLVSLEHNARDAAARAWLDLSCSCRIGLTSDHDMIRNLPDADHVSIYNFRTDTNRDDMIDLAHMSEDENGEAAQRPMSPILEFLTWGRGEKRPAFIGTFGLRELSLKVCDDRDDMHTSHIIEVRLGPWNHVPVHGDHLAQLAEIATKSDVSCAQYLREEAEEWQDEIDIAAARADAPKV